MNSKIIVFIAIGIAAVIGYYLGQSPFDQPTSSLPATINVSGRVATSTSGSTPISVDFISNNQHSTFPITGGFYSASLANQHSYDIEIKYSLKIIGNTTIVPPAAACGTLQLNTTSNVYHYDIMC